MPTSTLNQPGIPSEASGPRRRRMEAIAFVFLTLVLVPGLAVATVGGYGLTVWIYQMIAGPPGPPSR
jgi:nitrate reductase NapE